jgi:hypothetical protein
MKLGDYGPPFCRIDDCNDSITMSAPTADAATLDSLVEAAQVTVRSQAQWRSKFFHLEGAEGIGRNQSATSEGTLPLLELLSQG